VRGWEVNISEDARHWIGLLQYNPSTVSSNPEVGRNTGSMAGRSGSIASTLEGVKDKLTVSFQLTLVKKVELTLLFKYPYMEPC
jgi:hypothetical protein